MRSGEVLALSVGVAVNPAVAVNAERDAVINVEPLIRMFRPGGDVMGGEPVLDHGGDAASLAGVGVPDIDAPTPLEQLGMEWRTIPVGLRDAALPVRIRFATHPLAAACVCGPVAAHRRVPAVTRTEPARRAGKRIANMARRYPEGFAAMLADEGGAVVNRVLASHAVIIPHSEAKCPYI